MFCMVCRTCTCSSVGRELLSDFEKSNATGMRCFTKQRSERIEKRNLHKQKLKKQRKNV